MPRLALNLSALNQQRQRLLALQAQQRELNITLAAQQTSLDAALRAGQSPNVTEILRVQLDAARTARGDLVARRRELERAINQLANGLRGERDPAQMTTALDGGQPIALLPMRLETRYFPVFSQAPNSPPPDSLRIRVYPDDLNIVQHTAALTEAERQAGTDYWRARFRQDDAAAERVARDLAATQGRSRCAWIFRVLNPDNTDQIGQLDPATGERIAPLFPDIPATDARAKQTRAVLLPDRWCAIGYASGRREVFRVWGERIPDELILTPDWLNQDDANREALFDGERAWLVDFDKALAKGMALQVNQRDVRDFNLATDTLERLIVVGLEWTKDAAQSAAELAELLAAQRDSEGLGFIPLGTPTNNTEAAPSGYSPSEARTPPPTEAENAQLPAQKDALQLLVHALGLPADSLAAEGIENAHLAEQRSALHMMNALWRGTFGHYLMELWNPPTTSGDDGEKDRLLKTPTLYNLRWYAINYLRPAGALPLLRVAKQPYGILPVVGKAYTDADAIESGIGKVLGVLRPIWDIAVHDKVPLLKNGDMARAQDILQTNAWSQVAQYRDAANLCITQQPFFLNDLNPEKPSKLSLIQNLLAGFGVESAYKVLPIFNCTSFPPDPYTALPLTAVPWVLADDQDASKEAPAAANFKTTPPETNYLRHMADHITDDVTLTRFQSGPALLQALLSYSVQMERHDAVGKYAQLSAAVVKFASLAAPSLLYVEARQETVAQFAINTPAELASVVIPSLTGGATLGEHFKQRLAAEPVALVASPAAMAAAALFLEAERISPQLRDVSAVKLSLSYLAERNVGELNTAFRTTLDAFSYRLDAWYSARANHRLDQLRVRKPTGVYVGGFAWVENLKADRRPDSDGHLLAPSLGQAASAALLRSGFMANHEQGAFNIDLDSARTRRALDILQGLTRDQPLAALYGYRIERGLRDALLGKLIWPLRLAFPWRAAGANASAEPKDAVGARDVVDGVALLAAWQADVNAVRTQLELLIGARGLPPKTLLATDWLGVGKVVQDALDLADSVSDLLMAEGVHQIVQGNFERAGAAMAVIDKQSLPIAPQVANTPRGGASYTQRMALLCPPVVQTAWPRDRRATAEPAFNAWLAHMLGDPTRYVFSAQALRGLDANKKPIIDPQPLEVGLQTLGLSPLSAMLTATTLFRPETAGAADTGLRGRLVAAFTQQIANPDTVTGLNIQQEGAHGHLGLGDFEALATTLRALLDKARPITRKDMVVPDDAIGQVPIEEGEYPGVDVPDLRARADALIADFSALTLTMAGSAAAADLLANLHVMADFISTAAWPQQVRVLQDATHTADDFSAALSAVNTLLQARLDAVNEPIVITPPREEPTHGQLVQQAIDQIKLLLGKDFPVLPRFSLAAYASEFNAALAGQADLTLNNPWQVSGWLPQLARVHDGLDRFAAALSAHEVLVDLSGADDFKVVQYPHYAQRAWAALPEAWRENEGTPLDTGKIPEELHDYLAQQPGAPYRDINRVVPKLALALYTPGGLDGVAADDLLAGLVCDEWAEFIPDRFQTAGIAFHYDAPGARPPQSILLALPPTAQQENWQFEQLLDVLHEAWDLARLRAVRPQDLDSGVGALLPGNFLPQNYTGTLPSVTLRRMALTALDKFKSSIIPLGKV